MKENSRVAVGALVAAVAVVSFNILYTNHSNRVDDQRWCDLMVGLDQRYQALDTKDPDALRFKAQVRTLRSELSCPPPGPPQTSPSP